MHRENEVQHVFLVGAKSLGAYGGYETFVNKLTEYHQNDCRIKYHVACKANGQGAMIPAKIDGAVITSPTTFTYHNSECFQINIPERLGPAQAIYYDCSAMTESVKIIKAQKINNPIVYVMTCRIGPFFGKYVNAIHKLGGKVYLNPDGHEWKRAKWSRPVRAYWKKSEELMVKQSDLIICDSINIEKYIKKRYGVTNTTYIAYGAETRKSVGADERYAKWLKEKGLSDGCFYLVVGRFIPENNYETMICEFMKSNTTKDLAIITNSDEKFLEELDKKLGFQKDKRIKFVGTVYDQELLMKIREQAYAYLHGHEVGGTNPSLIEALGSTELNLLLNVGFNQEVGLESALYWTKEDGNLAQLIDKADAMKAEDRLALGAKAKERVRTAYSWKLICDRYAEEFLR
ncbi:DUF1972 domain-containing protein [Clostridium sp. M62/1]|uniref:beta 1-4 rhamnosyltransferase Cps2T n=1 Tax=Clostridium sp. M62/1 TaxID=411486 RepID=UPI000197374E|nr:DUF1972 domain-containing protein [Clostridium sp. M62/1]EFE14042.1 hypothetical protein CLOM621_05618 [Clostridium sp. M62/1]UEB80296.1 DUF1972 domain-containing protein [Clostridium sp. M62/1]